MLVGLVLGGFCCSFSAWCFCQTVLLASSLGARRNDYGRHMGPESIRCSQEAKSREGVKGEAGDLLGAPKAGFAPEPDKCNSPKKC